MGRPARANVTKKETLRRMRSFSKRKKAFVASGRGGATQLEAEVMKLDLHARAALAEKLLASLDELTESERDELWAAEAERRAEELRSGEVAALDGDEVMRRARRAIS
jgi:putative addiction module component (TIGR02574 family)